MSTNGIITTLLDRRIGSFGDASDYENDTIYKLRFWKYVYTQPRNISIIANDTLVGEINHPDERYRDRSIDLTKVSHRVRNIRFIDAFGNLLAFIDNNGIWQWAVDNVDEEKATGDIIADVDILDTPMGKILNVYALSGTNIGFSSRADGKMKKDSNGNRVPLTYTLWGIDAVWRPSKSNARILDESAEENIDEDTIENNIVTLINNEEVEEDKKLMEEFIKNYGTDGLKDKYFGKTIEISSLELERLRNSSTEDRENLYSNIRNIKKKLATLIYELFTEIKKEELNKEEESDLTVIEEPQVDNEYNEELVEDLMKENLDLQSQISELSQVLAEKEQTNGVYLRYIILREFPKAKNHEAILKAFVDSGLELSYANLQKVYNELVFKPTVMVQDMATKIEVPDEYSETSERIKKLIIGGKK